MEKNSQECILSFNFKRAIEREEFLVKKYGICIKNTKDKKVKDLITRYLDNANEHTKLLKDKMLKLNIQG